MVLYIGASLYHILCFSIHKLLYHPKEDAMLVVGDNIFSKSGMDELKNDIMAVGIFQDMKILKFIDGAYRNPVRLTEESREEDVKRFIKENDIWVENWLSSKKINLKEMTNIYSSIDHRHLGLYILSKKIPYAYFEDGNGLLSREYVQLEFHKNAQYESYAVCKQLGALGNNPYVTKKYANMEAQLPGFEDEKVENFQVISLFKALEEQDQKIIFRMYHMEEILDFHGEKPVLFLTRYAKYMKNPTIDRHHFMATFLIDVFGGENPIVLKAHPRDFSGRYAEILPGAKIMARQFPSELLPFVTKEKYQKVITVGSTAIDALAEASEQVIKLDQPFEEKLNSIYGYTAMVLAIKESFADLKKGDIAYVGPLLEYVKPLGKEILGFEIVEAKKGKKYPLLWLDEIQVLDVSGENICTLQPRYMQQIDETKMMYMSVCVKHTRKESFGVETKERICFQTNRSIEIELQRDFLFTGSKLVVKNFSKEQQDYQRECDKIKSMEPKLDLIILDQNIKEADIVAMRQLKRKLSMRK